MVRYESRSFVKSKPSGIANPACPCPTPHPCLVPVPVQSQSHPDPTLKSATTRMMRTSGGGGVAA
ncbi:hypothetical protein BDZ97DRAFT_1828631, partial [Flammula alnicola]